MPKSRSVDLPHLAEILSILAGYHYEIFIESKSGIGRLVTVDHVDWQNEVVEVIEVAQGLPRAVTLSDIATITLQTDGHSVG